MWCTHASLAIPSCYPFFFWTVTFLLPSVWLCESDDQLTSLGQSLSFLRGSHCFAHQSDALEWNWPHRSSAAEILSYSMVNGNRTELYVCRNCSPYSMQKSFTMEPEQSDTAESVKQSSVFFWHEESLISITEWKYHSSQGSREPRCSTEEGQTQSSVKRFRIH